MKYEMINTDIAGKKLMDIVFYNRKIWEIYALYLSIEWNYV